MNIKKLKSTNRTCLLTLFFLTISIIFPIAQTQSYNSGSNTQSQYSSYSSYSPSTNQDDFTNGDNTGKVTSFTEPSELKKNNRISDGVASDRSSDGKNKPSHSIFYYEMLPAERQRDPRQICTYTGGEMKCTFKRESSGSQQTNSYSQEGATIPEESYSVPKNNFETPLSQYGNPKLNHASTVRQYGTTVSQYPSNQDSYGAPTYGSEQPYGYPKQDYGFPGTGVGGTGVGVTGSGGGGLGGLGGLAGLAGLLGLKGLKKDILRSLLFLPLLPILLPIFIAVLLLPLLPLILLLPIPVVVTGRSFDTSNMMSLNGTDVSLKLIRLRTIIPQVASDVIGSDECVERISCEIARMSRNYKVSDWLDRFAENLPKSNRIAKKIYDGMLKNREFVPESRNATTTSTNSKISQDSLPKFENFNSSGGGGECSIFVCKPRANFVKYFVK